MRTKWKLLIAIAAVVVIVAVAVVLINLRPTEQASQPEPTAGTDMVAGKLGFPVSKISIGEGGTTTAADGKTPLGYNGTCDSAAQAAANYTPVLHDVNTKTWEAQKATMKTLASDEAWIKDAVLLGDTYTTAAASGSFKSFDGGWLDRVDVKAGGLYRLVSCEAEIREFIQVFYGGLRGGESEPGGYFGTDSLELVWDGDWKISDALVRIDDTELADKFPDQGPAGGLVGAATGEMPTLDNGLVGRYFENLSKEGWVEYANATR